MINYVNSEEQYIQNYILFVKGLDMFSNDGMPTMTLYHDPELQNGVTKGELADMFVTSPIIVSFSSIYGVKAYMNALSYIDTELDGKTCGAIMGILEDTMMLYSVEAEDTASE